MPPGTLIEKAPLLLVVVPVALLPFGATFTPASATPVSEVTFTVIGGSDSPGKLFCRENNRKTKKTKGFLARFISSFVCNLIKCYFGLTGGDNQNPNHFRQVNSAGSSKAGQFQRDV